MNNDQRQFVRAYVIRCCPRGDSAMEACVEAAEWAWAYLCSRGYGCKQNGEPRRSEDCYAALSPDQRRDFDRFWKAYGWKHGKQQAAKTWGQLDPDPETVAHILYAARKASEARDPRNGAPKWAQGWLSERRWTDWDMPKPKQEREVKDHGERRHAQEMAALCELQGKHDQAAMWKEKAKP